MDENFKGKTVIITGGSEGVGAATARKFADSGANLLLVARGKKKLELIAEELRGRTRVEIMAMDVSDEDACANLFRKAAFEFGEIHVLINNAGYHERGAVETISTQDLGMMIDVNLKAPIVLCRLVVPYMREAGGGAIVNVASLAGRVPVPGAATYSATKFGLRAFTFALGDPGHRSDRRDRRPRRRGRDLRRCPGRRNLPCSRRNPRMPASERKSRLPGSDRVPRHRSHPLAGDPDLRRCRHLRW